MLKRKYEQEMPHSHTAYKPMACGEESKNNKRLINCGLKDDAILTTES